mmetsp:Transcript_40262/g.79407  ORF Transcript_40262/g.79407 Transcript_40262/m.79407 type:complete len:167 (-) Transcript_40262:914-1414(-)
MQRVQIEASTSIRKVWAVRHSTRGGRQGRRESRVKKNEKQASCLSVYIYTIFLRRYPFILVSLGRASVKRFFFFFDLQALRERWRCQTMSRFASRPSKLNQRTATSFILLRGQSGALFLLFFNNDPSAMRPNANGRKTNESVDGEKGNRRKQRLQAVDERPSVLVF